LSCLESIEEAEPGPKENTLLQELITRIRLFIHTVDFELIIGHMELSKELNTDFVRGIKEKFEKLANYRSISRCLLNYAKAIPQFKHTVIERVTEAPVQFQHTYSRADLGMMLTKCGLDAAAQSILKTKPLVQHKNYNSLVRQFTNTAQKTTESGRVHAEVQLLSYYEMNKVSFPPRVIVSTKKACFLCNELLTVHGMYYTPNTHGRLYPGWLLTQSLAGPKKHKKLLRRLNSRIQEHNARLLGQILSDNPLRKLPYPNESCVNLISASKSFLVTSAPTALPGLSGSQISNPSQSPSGPSTITPHLQSTTVEPEQQPTPPSSPPLLPAPSPAPSALSSPISEAPIDPLQGSPPPSPCPSSTSASSRSGEDTPRALSATHLVPDHALEPVPNPTPPRVQSPLLPAPALPPPRPAPRSRRLRQGVPQRVVLDPAQAAARVYTDFFTLLLERPGKAAEQAAAAGTAPASGAPAVVFEVEWLVPDARRGAVGDGAGANVHDACGLSDETETETTCVQGGEMFLRVGGEVVRVRRP
jgi:hypothetical protein